MSLNMPAGVLREVTRDVARMFYPAPGIDIRAAEEAVRSLLVALGQDPEAEHLRQTPRRVAAAYSELLTPGEFELTTFENEEGYAPVHVTSRGARDRVAYIDVGTHRPPARERCGQAGVLCPDKGAPVSNREPRPEVREDARPASACRRVSARHIVRSATRTGHACRLGGVIVEVRNSAISGTRRNARKVFAQRLRGLGGRCMRA